MANGEDKRLERTPLRDGPTERSAGEERRPRLDERHPFEILLSRLSTEFVNFPVDQLDPLISVSLWQLCEQFDLDVGVLWQETGEPKGPFRLTHIYRRLEGPPLPDVFDAQEYFPGCLRWLYEGRKVVFRRLEDAPLEEFARDVEVWRIYGVRSTLTFPLSAGGGPVFGALAFNTIRKDGEFPDGMVARLELFAHLFGNAIARKKAIEKLSESESRLKLVTDLAGAGTWIMDLATRQVWVNNITRRLFHMPPDEDPVYDTFFRVIHPDDRQAVDRSVRKAVRTNSTFDIEYRVVNPDGDVTWIASRGQPYSGASGVPDRLVGVSVDVTSRKEAELGAAALNSEMALANRRNLMGRLAASLAHELNQPLAAIRSNAEAAQELMSRPRPNMKEIREIISDIIQDDTRASEVIRKTRALIKNRELQDEPLAIETVVREVLEMMRISIIQSGISVALEVSPDLSLVRGDRIHLQQVLMNLITNAIDAMRGSSEKKLVLSAGMTEEGTVMVSVADSGIGLGGKTPAELFKPFYTTKQEGLGMGLAICESIIEAHGGKLQAQNNPARGATFSFSLPAWKDAPD